MVPGRTRGQLGPHSAAQASILSSHLLALLPPQAPLPGLGERSPTENIPPRRLIHLGPGQGLKGSEPRGSIRRDPTADGSHRAGHTRLPLVPMGHSWWPGSSGALSRLLGGLVSPAASHQEHCESASAPQEHQGEGSQPRGLTEAPSILHGPGSKPGCPHEHCPSAPAALRTPCSATGSRHRIYPGVQQP